MSRLIFLFAIAAVVYLLLKSYRKDESANKPAEPEDMVRCAHCGVHLPVSESVRDGDLYFCSAAHRDAHRT